MKDLAIAAANKESISPPPLGNYDAVGWRWQRWHLWLLVAGLLIRIGFCLLTSKESALAEVDGREHYAYAQSLLALRWDDYPRYFNCIRPPLYPIFLMPFVALNNQIVWHIQFVQSIMGVLLAVVLAVIAGRWAGQRAGNWAFAIALLHPFLIFHCAYLLTEILFITLLWCGIACLQRWGEPLAKADARWLIYGAIALALACLTRPALQPFLVVAVMWIGWIGWQRGNRLTALRQMIYFTALVSGILLPVMLANLRAHEDLSLSPNCAQRLYALGNSAEYLSLYEAQTKEEYYHRLNQINTLLSAEAGKPAAVWINEVRLFRQEQPARWLRLQWYKFKHFWTPWLNPLIFPQKQVIISFLSTTPLFLLAGAEIFRRRARGLFLWLLLGLIAVGYFVSGFLFHVQVRYRIPFVDVTFIILTASFLGQLTFKKVTGSRLLKPFRAAEAL